MAQIIQLQDVQVGFNGRCVLDIAELNFTVGHTYALIGPSGAGKSTLLRVLNLLQKPSRGQVIFEGSAVKYGGPESLTVQRSMAMVFQRPATFSGSVAYNVALGLQVRGTNKKQAQEQVAAALQMVGLAEYAQRAAVTLSGGEAQRMALARALVTKPRVLLLDEPTANLDPANVAMLEDIIRQVAQSRETTIIMVTHNLHQAKRVAGETIFLNRGKLVEQGPTETIFANPGHPETKMFISGEMIY